MQKRLDAEQTGNGAARGLKMAALVRRTGISRTAILFYARQGLLGEPIRLKANFHLYPEGVVDRLLLIKRLQSEQRLKLSAIKKYLGLVEGGAPVQTLIELGCVLSLDGAQAGGFGVDTAKFCDLTGLTRPEVERLTREGILMPTRPGRYDAEDVEYGRILRRYAVYGFKPSDLRRVRRVARALLREELALRNRLVRRLPPEVAVKATLDMARDIRFVRRYVLDRMLDRRVREAMARGEWLPK
ncbi:MAG: MerR family transcriptional regulator [Nitrospirae bacterium]|nr:MerR family transcriptional regulator [Nitrospirota bacterium]